MATVSSEQLAQAVHAQGVRLVIVVTGGGSGAIPALLTVPGASRSVLSAAVPYASAALVEWLGFRPEEFCSASTARAMAMCAYVRARQLDPAAPACGVACTASLASDRPKRGPHRAHFAFQTADTTATLSLELEKGLRDRATEEALVASVLLNHIAEGCGASARVEVPLAAGESIAATHAIGSVDEQDLLAGRIAALPVHAATLSARPLVVFPGAFNPLHPGHRQMAAIAEQMLGQQVAFEISIENVDKTPLDFISVADRARQFSPEQALWFTRAPHFTIKSELFPAATFVVGLDTIERVAQPRYYGGEAGLQQAIADISARGCSFLVFGRSVEGKFRTLQDLNIAAELVSLCREVPESVFHDDISSTSLRNQSKTE